MNIIKPRLELIVPVHFGMAGFYRLKAGKRDQSPRIDTGWFPNLITDWGLNAKGTVGANGLGFYFHVGAGNTAPTVGDTTLETWIASTLTQQATSEGAQASAPYYGWHRLTRRFGEGVAAGNIAEVGVGPSGGSADNLFSRALVLDALGSPTAITVLADEILDVTYEIRMYPPTTDGQFTISGHNVTTRAAHVTNTSNWGGGQLLAAANWAEFQTGQSAYDGNIGLITEGPSGLRATRTSFSALPYQNNSLEREIEVFFGLNDGNLATNVRSLVVRSNGNLGAFQLQYEPRIAKDDTKELTLGMKVGWGRASI